MSVDTHVASKKKMIIRFVEAAMKVIARDAHHVIKRSVSREETRLIKSIKFKFFKLL